MKYRYHIRIYFHELSEEFRHSFNSDSEILKMSEVREQIQRKASGNPSGFLVLNICKTIND